MKSDGFPYVDVDVTRQFVPPAMTSNATLKFDGLPYQLENKLREHNGTGQTIDILGTKFMIVATNVDYGRHNFDRPSVEVRLAEVFASPEPAFMCESEDFGCGKCRSQCEPCRRARS